MVQRLEPGCAGAHDEALGLERARRGKKLFPMDSNKLLQGSQLPCSSLRKKGKAKNGRIIESQKSRKNETVKD